MTREISVELLPAPIRKLKPKQAARWIREDFPGLLAVVEHAFFCPMDGPTREAVTYLAYELGKMVKLCVVAIDEGCSVRVERDTSVTAEPCQQHSLALLLETRWRTSVECGDASEPGFRLLQEELTRRLAANLS